MATLALDTADVEIIIESLTLWENHLKTSLLMKCLLSISTAENRLAAQQAVDLYEKVMDLTALDQQYHRERAILLKAKLVEAKNT